MVEGGLEGIGWAGLGFDERHGFWVGCCSYRYPDQVVASYQLEMVSLNCIELGESG